MSKPVDNMDFLDKINPNPVVEDTKKPALKGLAGKAVSAVSNDGGSDFENAKEGEAVISLNTELISPNPFQNRRRFKKISELAAKINDKGQIQPCVVRKIGSRYELAAGERRKRACELLGIALKVIVRELSDEEMRSICTSENEDREDTNIVEKYLGIRDLFDDKKKPKTHEEVAKEFEISTATLARVLKLDYVPKALVEKLAESQLADCLKFLRAEEIGNAFRDNPEQKDQIAVMLEQQIELFEHQHFEVESKQEEETNLTIKAFLHAVKMLNKSGNGSSTAQINPIHDLKIDNAVVGQLKTTGRSMSVTIKKEDMPEDLYNQFIEHIKSFFVGNKKESSE